MTLSRKHLDRKPTLQTTNFFLTMETSENDQIIDAVLEPEVEHKIIFTVMKTYIKTKSAT